MEDKMKTCNICKEEKELSMFGNNKKYKDGLQALCKSCAYEEQKEYTRTKKGLITVIYRSQKQRSKVRGHRFPEYTKQELKEWLYSQKEFHEIYSEWKASGYKKELCPSVDRKNDYIHYTFSNIQLMTWGENNSKGHNDRRNGVNSKHSKQVFQYTLKGELIKSYNSTMEVQRELGIGNSQISACCLGKADTAGGFRWGYK